jgi:membrane associated rhomboid family serine protease
MLVAMTVYSFDFSTDPVILVGASANVMGLVGLTAAAALARYRTTGSIEAKAQLGTMIQIVLLQIIFDLLVPEVSSTAHLGGAVTGFVFGTSVQIYHRFRVTKEIA